MTPNKPTTLRESLIEMLRESKIYHPSGELDPEVIIKYIDELLASHSTELLSKIEGLDTCKRCRELLQSKLCLTKTKKIDENNGEGGLEITEKIE